MTEGQHLPEITLEALATVQDLGTIEHLFTPEEVARYADFLADPSPWYRPVSPESPVRVHPMLLANDYSILLRNHFQTPHLVLIQTAHTYLRPAWTGQRLRTFGRIVDKGITNRRDYVEVETWTVDEEETEVARMLTTALLSVKPRAES